MWKYPLRGPNDVREVLSFPSRMHIAIECGTFTTVSVVNIVDRAIVIARAVCNRMWVYLFTRMVSVYEEEEDKLMLTWCSAYGNL